MAKAKVVEEKRGFVTYSTDWEDQVSKIYYQKKVLEFGQNT